MVEVGGAEGLGSVEVWGKLVNMEESRIVKKVSQERRKELLGKGKHSKKNNWLVRTRQILLGLGLRKEWEEEKVGTKAQWGATLTKAIGEREEKLWRKEVEQKPKLRTYRLLKTKLSFEPYLNCGDAWRRGLVAALRCGTNMLAIETGRHTRKQLHERVCMVCKTNQVEDEQHFLIECKKYKVVREDMYKEVKSNMMRKRQEQTKKRG